MLFVFEKSDQAGRSGLRPSDMSMGPKGHRCCRHPGCLSTKADHGGSMDFFEATPFKESWKLRRPPIEKKNMGQVGQFHATCHAQCPLPSILSDLSDLLVSQEDH